MTTQPRLLQISVNPNGGVPKYRVAEARITRNGVVGDKQNQVQFHGGPERAVCMFSFELIQKLQEEGHPIEPGTTGENFTVTGLDWAKVVPGARLLVGQEVELEVASYAAPCNHIAASFDQEEFTRIGQKVHPGWSRVYTRVLREGVVKEGDAVTMG